MLWEIGDVFGDKLEIEILLELRLCAMSALSILGFSSSGGRGCLLNEVWLKEFSCDNILLHLLHPEGILERIVGVLVLEL